MTEQVIIKKITENEIWLNENHFLLSDYTLCFTRRGDIDIIMARSILETINNLANTKKNKINLCIDIEYSGKTSSEARKIFKRYISKDNINKIAIVGTHSVAKIVASFFIGFFSKNREIKFFKSKEEAFLWFKEK